MKLTEPGTPSSDFSLMRTTPGHFDFGRYLEMRDKEHQPPLDIDGQIENLKSIGLVIDDIEYAKSILNDISYFRLIKAYSLGLKVKNGNYHKGIEFEQIVDLYLFNSNLRQLLFPAIEVIEINLRCRISNWFSSKYGCLGYEDSANFQNAEYHCDFVGEIHDAIKRNSRSPFVSNFQKNYTDGKIPFYALIELFSFGLLSKFYKNMKNEDKKSIAKSFGIGYTYFESWIESIAFVRNICAHYGRLYNIKLTKSPTLYSQYDQLSNNRVFSIFICIKYILGDSKVWNEVYAGLDKLIAKHPSVDLNKLGFPSDWKEVLTA